jgi:conjugative transposon TraJ protein
MRRFLLYMPALLATLLLPSLLQAQTAASPVDPLNTSLSNVYSQMIPLCSQLITVTQGFAAFGALFYIGVRVWKHIARAEAIDFFPLFRPFVLTLLIGIYPDILALINGLLSPTVVVTTNMAQNANSGVQSLLNQQANEVNQTSPTQPLMAPDGSEGQNWSKYAQPNSSGSGGFWSTIGNDLGFAMSQYTFNIGYVIRYFLSILFEVLYYAAALCIDTIRIFHLVILAILGPFAFSISVYDGFHQSLTHWLARYVNVYMWLPIANLLGALLGQIQQNMIQSSPANGVGTFIGTNITYLIFLVIGIIAYTTVPGIANYIIHTHSPNPIMNKVNSIVTTSTKALAAAMV